MPLVLGLLAAGAPSLSPSTPTETKLSFDLPRAATTSAGIYDREGRLLRTLWRGEALPAGVHERAWDGRDDRGRPVASGEVEALVLHHRIRYVWEGVVGNTSTDRVGAGVHHAFLPPASLAIARGRLHYAVGYNEGQPGLLAFDLARPQKALRVLRSTDPFASHALLATDGQRLYWADGGGLSKTTFVGAFDLDAARAVPFTRGRTVCLQRRPAGPCYEDTAYEGVADVETEAMAAPTGLAVQARGRVLAVAHGGLGLIRLLDKTTGERLGEIALPLAAGASNQLAMTPGGDLWVVSGDAVLRYAQLERQPVVVDAIRGLARPLAVATSPSDDGVLWIADGGPSQQLKRRGPGGTVTVLGREGGYAADPAARDDKLCFRGEEGRERTALAVDADASIWVVDTCNNRMLRFAAPAAAPGTADLQVAYLPHGYTATVDHGDPQRVFANFLEFAVDRQLGWRLVRNWLPSLPSALADPGLANSGFGGFVSVETLASGRTIGLVESHGRQVVVELPASGPLRVVKLLGAPLPQAARSVLYEGGELGHALIGPATQSVLRLAVAGFDAQGLPEWADAPRVVARVPLAPGAPYYRGAFSGMPPRFPSTAGGRVVFFDGSVRGNEGFHLGAAVAGVEGWLWQASPTGPLDGKGAFQTQAIDGSIQYGGNAVWASGRHIVYGFHGEAFKDPATGRVGQANQFMHFDESGLFLGQFGTPALPPGGDAPAEVSGNAFSPTLVRDGDRLYLYHNDESAHGGVHRWRLDGWNDVQELRGRGAAGGTIVLR
jgi:hypothetical protein